MGRIDDDVSHFREIFWLIVSGLMSLLMAAPAMASCTAAPDGQGAKITIILPVSVAVPRNAAPGQIVWDSGWTPSVVGSATCNSPSDTRSLGYLQAKVPVPGFDGVYETGIPGIGMKSAIILGASKPADINAGTVQRYPAVTEAAGAGTFDETGSGRIQYIVTGPVSTGVTNMGIALGGRTYVGGTRGLNLNVGNGRNSTVTVASCTVQNSTFTVPVSGAYSHQLGAVGSTTGDTSFNLALNCPAGISVAVTFTDVSNPGNRTTNLSLSSNSTGAGVAYQLVYGSQVVAFGPDSASDETENQIHVGPPTVSGSTNIPFSVRYVRTGPLKAGTLNAKATFTMSYQ
jgi:type 1 fimbria pilin